MKTKKSPALSCLTLLFLSLSVGAQESPSPTPSPSPSSAASGTAPAAVAPTPKKTQNLPALLAEVEAAYSKGSTYRASFEQKEFVAAMNRVKKTHGTIEVKRPDKLRWETVNPDANLLVSDGKKFWFYTPPFDEGERGQLIEKKASQVNSRLAQHLISGSFSMAKDMKIETIDATHFRLVPRKGAAGSVKYAEITVDPVRKEISQVKLEHRGSNRSDISLTQIEIGHDLPDSHFQFVAPANTDRVDP